MRQCSLHHFQPNLPARILTVRPRYTAAARPIRIMRSSPGLPPRMMTGFSQHEHVLNESQNQGLRITNDVLGLLSNNIDIHARRHQAHGHGVKTGICQ